MLKDLALLHFHLLRDDATDEHGQHEAMQPYAMQLGPLAERYSCQE
jgi:hypothetical protein